MLKRLLKILKKFVSSNIDIMIENITIKPHINKSDDIEFFIASESISPRLESFINEVLLPL